MSRMKQLAFPGFLAVARLRAVMLCAAGCLLLASASPAQDAPAQNSSPQNPPAQNGIPPAATPAPAAQKNDQSSTTAPDDYRPSLLKNFWRRRRPKTLLRRRPQHQITLRMRPRRAAPRRVLRPPMRAPGIRQRTAPLRLHRRRVPERWALRPPPHQPQRICRHLRRLLPLLRPPSRPPPRQLPSRWPR